VSDLRTRVVLGRSGLAVSRLGVGGSYGVSTRACLRAFDAGINYFYWGAKRMPGMGLAIREIGRAGRRDELVLVLQTFSRSAHLAERSVARALRSLGVEQADVLLLGWHDRAPTRALLEAAAKLRERGLTRCLAISSHSRPMYREHLAGGLFDVFHVRYSAAHRGAEQDAFPHLPRAGGPGIVTFTSTRWGDLLEPKNMPAGQSPPSASDCYRFALSNPHVHVVATGPASDAEMDAVIATLPKGPLDEEALERMRLIGDHVHGLRTLKSLLG
jgi:aryl-alcohol dehydrogenase-like predicted oxidoreductase